MTMHRLRLFVAAARHFSITKASQELRISQPSVSHQLKLLQEQVGAILFVKTNRGIKLTDQGQALLKDAVSILTQIETLDKKYRQTVSPKAAGSLTVGGSHEPSAALLPWVMAHFRQQNQSVELSLRTGSSAEIQDLVVRSEVEIAVATEPAPCSLLTMEPLRKEKLSFFVVSNHPISKNSLLNITEISKLPLIIREGKKGSTRIEELIASRCNQNGKLQVSMRCDSPESVKAAVRNGAGVGILYHDLVKEDVRRGVFRIVKVRGLELSGTSHIIYSKDKALSSYAKTFLGLLRNAASVYPSKPGIRSHVSFG